MLRFSANLGFLWTELALPDAVRRAHAAGFDAVECTGLMLFRLKSCAST
ncbi:hydroxypyruvate isomerase [Nitratireductor aquibiodomus RA22]|uniref:Hydroxypyruvate isomerase n=1 Tax=Nitratireductor aquibiodomus RA22 TaxID=1189611 RepID=I5BWA9_9HYPH|nr:hydroxypyruvate isomerase [Nitratireductor aquibiodomus RA22]